MYDLIGHSAQLTFLRNSFAHGTNVASYLFAGQSGVGKSALIETVLRDITCAEHVTTGACGTCRSCAAWSPEGHPDVYVIALEDDAGHIGIQEIRALQQFVALTPAFTRFRVAWIPHAEQLTIEAANALLKTLEEPPEHAILLLSATSVQSVPQTVASRCQTLLLHPIAADTIYHALQERGATTEQAVAYTRIAQGRPGIALALLQQPEAFTTYEHRVMQALDLLEEPVWQRLVHLQQLLPKGKDAATLRAELSSLLHIWTLVFRDLLLMKRNAAPLVLHGFATARLQHVAEQRTSSHLLQAVRALTVALDRLQHNVQPAAVLPTLVTTL